MFNSSDLARGFIDVGCFDKSSHYNCSEYYFIKYIGLGLQSGLRVRELGVVFGSELTLGI